MSLPMWIYRDRLNFEVPSECYASASFNNSMSGYEQLSMKMIIDSYLNTETTEYNILLKKL